MMIAFVVLAVAASQVLAQESPLIGYTPYNPKQTEPSLYNTASPNREISGLLSQINEVKLAEFKRQSAAKEADRRWMEEENRDNQKFMENYTQLKRRFEVNRENDIAAFTALQNNNQRILNAEKQKLDKAYQESLITLKDLEQIYQREKNDFIRYMEDEKKQHEHSKNVKINELKNLQASTKKMQDEITALHKQTNEMIEETNRIRKSRG